MANYDSQDFLSEVLNISSQRIRIGLVTAMWNTPITSKLKTGALELLTSSGIPEENIEIWDVPGSYELIYAANKLANDGFDAVICLGVIIQGETRHFDFIADAVANGLATVTTKHNIPVGFGVLTTDNESQAIERAGGAHGNKGTEAAWTVLKLLSK